MATATKLPSAPTDPSELAQNAEAFKGSSLRFDTPRWVGEPKLDGWRILIHVSEDGVHLFSRTGKCYDGHLPGIEAEVEALPPGTWLDGEAVALQVNDGQVTHDWSVVQSVLGSSRPRAAALSEKITFVAFDLIAHGGIDARRLSYAKRRQLLTTLFDQHDFDRLMLVPQVTPTDDSLHRLLAQGFEGMIVKDTLAPYASGKRGAGWLKVKPQETLDAVVMDFTVGENGFTGLVGAVVFGLHDAKGKLVEAGRCSGMTMTVRQDMTDRPRHWLGAVIEVKHMGQMPSGGYRHPQFHRRRDDKAREACVLE